MNERYDDWSLTQEEMELMNYLDSKRRLAKVRARRTMEDIENDYSDEDFATGYEGRAYLQQLIREFFRANPSYKYISQVDSHCGSMLESTVVYRA